VGSIRKKKGATKHTKKQTKKDIERNVNSFEMFFKFKKFAFVRKFAFLIITLMFLKYEFGNILSATDFLKILIKFIGFFLMYSSIYVFNDIIDYRDDIKRKFIRESKILARGIVELDQFALFGSYLLITGSIISLIFMTKIEVLIIFGLILFGILRSYIKNLGLRSIALMIMEFANLMLFVMFVNSNFLFDQKTLLLASSVSIYYTILYYIYRKFEKENEEYVMKWGNVLIPALIIIFMLFPFSLFFRIYMAIMASGYALLWRNSIIKKSVKTIVYGGFIFLLISLVLLFI